MRAGREVSPQRNIVFGRARATWCCIWSWWCTLRAEWAVQLRNLLGDNTEQCKRGQTLEIAVLQWVKSGSLAKFLSRTLLSLSRPLEPFPLNLPFKAFLGLGTAVPQHLRNLCNTSSEFSTPGPTTPTSTSTPQFYRRKKFSPQYFFCFQRISKLFCHFL